MDILKQERQYRIFNPSVTVRGGFCAESQAPAAGVVIFGASGDLTQRKLLPAIFRLWQRSLLHDNFFILGCARSELDDEAFRVNVADALQASSEVETSQYQAFLEHCYYTVIQYDRRNDYERLAKRIASLGEQYQTSDNKLFYFAVPPLLYVSITENLCALGLQNQAEDGSYWSRFLVEKPFGRDLPSALELDNKLGHLLHESQIYRIDHYLAKETVQNVLMFRFANAVFEPIWNRQYIDHVQITVAESVGVGHRAGYFDSAGLLRDMFQNHVFQMLSLVAMEPPVSFDAERVRDEKMKLMRSIHPFLSTQLLKRVIRGQYTAGHISGQAVQGYRDEAGVADNSRTETYVAMKLSIDNWRWRGVPFYLRAGKRLPQKLSQINVVFKRIPHSMFSPLGPEDLPANVLTMNVQPNEGIELALNVKQPGPKLCMSSLKMAFNYADVFEPTLPDAYERLLLDSMLGDQTLFIREDSNHVSWSLLEPVLQYWDDVKENAPLHSYPAGSWGPREANVLLEQDEGRFWV